MPICAEAQKGIDKGKKSTRFWERCTVGWKYTWAQKSTSEENLSNFGGELVQFWGRISPILGENVSKLLLIH